MLELRQVSFSYGDVTVLRSVSLRLQDGECVAIAGLNGSGKSTLALLLAGLLLPDGGECLADGVRTTDDPAAVRQKVGLVFQDPDDQVVARRVGDDVAFGPLNVGATDVGARVSGALEAVGMGHLAGRDIHSLSGGQKQLVAIAGVLAMRPAYVVLDEPTSMLDSDGSRLVSEAVKSLKNSGIGVVLITHDPNLAALADRQLALSGGTLVPIAEARRSGAEFTMSETERLLARLRSCGIDVDSPGPGAEALLEALCRLKQRT